MFGVFVIDFIYFSLSLSFSVLLACLTMSPITLLHYLWASDVEICILGWRSLYILSFMWIGFRAWLLAASSGWSLVVMLHSFLSLANRPNCLRPALDTCCLSSVMVGVAGLGDCIGHMRVAMSLYSGTTDMTCVVAKSIGSVIVGLSVGRLVSV